jgi:uncharacterized protein YoxC
MNFFAILQGRRNKILDRLLLNLTNRSSRTILQKTETTFTPKDRCYVAKLSYKYQKWAEVSIVNAFNVMMRGQTKHVRVMSEEKLEQIDRRLNHLESDVSVLKADLSIVKQNVNALREDINEVRLRISSLEGTIVATIREGFGNTQANVQDVSYGLAENERRTRLLNQRVTRLERLSNDE